MRMRMLVSIAGYIGGELGCVQPGGIYTAVSENEAKSLYLAAAAVPESGVVPPEWIAPIVSPETAGKLVVLPDTFTISPATDVVPQLLEANVPGLDDPTDVLVEAVPAPATKPKAAKPKATKPKAAK